MIRIKICKKPLLEVGIPLAQAKADDDSITNKKRILNYIFSDKNLELKNKYIWDEYLMNIYFKEYPDPAARMEVLKFFKEKFKPNKANRGYLPFAPRHLEILDRIYNKFLETIKYVKIENNIPRDKKTLYRGSDGRWDLKSEPLSDRQTGLAYIWIKKNVFFNEEDPNDVLNILERTDTKDVTELLANYFGMVEFINKLDPSKANLLQIKNATDLAETISFFRDKIIYEKTMVSNEELIKGASKIPNLEKIIEDGKWHVYIPHTLEASRYLCQGTTWCISGESKFQYYYLNECPLITFLDSSKPYHKYTFTYARFEFKTRANLKVTRQQFKELSNLLIKHGFDKKYPCINNSDEIYNKGL